jgi:hypothetical protein
MSKKIAIPFDTATASKELINSMEIAIRNMTEELRKKPDQELSGSARRSELLSYKETALACKELILERQKLIQTAQEFEQNGELKEKSDFGQGFAETFAK